MSTGSSASSRYSQHRQFTGVPTKCWCGRKIITYCSQTDENPFRRFYRCEIAIQRKNEEHLFKWIDEALLDETRMVDAKLMKLVDEVKVLRNEMLSSFELQKKRVLDMEEEMKEKTKEEMMMANATIEEMGRVMARKSMERAGITLLVVGVIGWVCGKLMS
ncbi:hypothetical protein V5N11_014428 [Cardamine amara subsp. amara]|uniref:GRF-type domain-containing protein n=1 Tax=Cardamine amara subsp. amara TaxID=228776 RepID=A0ABD1B920_CARAN